MTAPPEKGKANAAIQAVLAEAWVARPSSVIADLRRDIPAEAVPDRRITADELTRRLALVLIANSQKSSR